MKKYLIYILTIIFVISFCQVGLAEIKTKYDILIGDNPKQNISEAVEIYDRTLLNTYFNEYYNLLLGDHHIKQIIQEGNIDNELKQFLMKDPIGIRKTIAVFDFMFLDNNIKPFPSEKEFILITGVIKDPHAQVARTGAEYVVEREFWRTHILYKIWEMYEAPGFRENHIKESVEFFLSESLKFKNK